MLQYNPRSWFSLIFKFHRGDTLNVLWLGMITVALYTAGMVYLERNVIQITNSVVIHSLLGFVISLLLVFRTNTAYDRWWEGRIQWGNLSTATRSLSYKMHALVPNGSAEEKKYIYILISNFAFALKEHLRGHKPFQHFQESEQFKIDSFQGISHVPNKILSLMYEEIIRLRNLNTIDSTQLRILDIDIAQLNNIASNCERIKATPIPPSYSMFLKKFIFVYILTLPFGFGEQLGYSLAPIVGFVFYVLLSLEVIAESIEDPFGNDTDDLPIDKIAHQIRRDTAEILDIGCEC